MLPSRLATLSSRLVIAALLIVATLAPSAAQGPRARPASAPEVRLVLLVAVDQFRYDYLTRFRTEFTGGLDTLLTKGAVFTDANLEHGHTVTAVGHSTMLSGALPSVSGIISNGWYDRATGKAVTSVSDPSATLIGSTGEASSPHRLLVSTLADEIKMAAGGSASVRPKAIGVSMKDRSAILPLGRLADAAYWFDNAGGAFVTSTYYMTAAPSWVTAFNARRLPDGYAGKRWSFGVGSGGHDLPRETGAKLNESAYTSPYGNELLLAFATEALTREKLGQRGVTDVFSVSFSSNDAVGHRYGPDSDEVHDIAVKTDADIGALLQAVDKLVGLSHTLVVFTTDHGVAPLPETALEYKLPGGRFQDATVRDAVQSALERKFGAGKWVLALTGNSVYLDQARMVAQDLDGAVVRRVAAEAAAAVPHVARVYTRDQLLMGAFPDDRISQRVSRNYHAQRSGDLEIVLDPFWIRGASGSTHGSPYNYDAQIPLILMGPGLRPGAYHAHAALNDVAPTLAALLQVATPAGSSGRVLVEALGR